MVKDIGSISIHYEIRIRVFFFSKYFFFYDLPEGTIIFLGVSVEFSLAVKKKKIIIIKIKLIK